MTQFGTIIEWDDGRGFGYINDDEETDAGRWSAFVNINDLRSAGAPAGVGVRIEYEVAPTSRHRPRAIPLRLA